MVKVVISDAKGLVQHGGKSGLSLENTASVRGPGLIGVVSEAQALSAVKADHDYTLELPAGAVLLDVGFGNFGSTAITTANTGGGDVLTATVGTSAGGTQIMASTSLLIRNKTAAAGVAASMANISGLDAASNKLENGSDAIPAFADTLVRHSSTARTIHVRVAVAGTALVSAGSLTCFAKYMIV